MTRGYAIALLILTGACASGRSTTYQESPPVVQEVLARSDVLECALATTDRLYWIPRKPLASELDALLSALRAASPFSRYGVRGVSVQFRDAVVAYRRLEVFEAAFEDGVLRVGWSPGRHALVSFRTGRRVAYMHVKASAEVDAAWIALSAAARAAAPTSSNVIPAQSPFEALREVGVDLRGAVYNSPLYGS